MAESLNKTKYIHLISGPGIAVDIDETLSWTIGAWVEQMQEKFGNPENLTVKEMVEKYRYVQNIPYWRHSEALAWIDYAIYSNEVQEILPLIEDANIYLSRINKIIPIAAYITVRPEKVSAGTKSWLEKHNFPAAPIICKPAEVVHAEGNKWKAEVLKELYPSIIGIIDDNAGLLPFLGQDYQGKVFLYDHHDNAGFSFAIACKSWIAVYKEIKQYFKHIC